MVVLLLEFMLAESRILTFRCEFLRVSFAIRHIDFVPALTLSSTLRTRCFSKPTIFSTLWVLKAVEAS